MNFHMSNVTKSYTNIILIRQICFNILIIFLRCSRLLSSLRVICDLSWALEEKTQLLFRFVLKEFLEMPMCATFFLQMDFHATMTAITCSGINLRTHVVLHWIMTTTSTIGVSSLIFATSSCIIIAIIYLNFILITCFHHICFR